MHIPGSELLPSLTPNGQKNHRQNLYQLCFFICTFGSSKFSGLSGPGPGQGPRSVRLKRLWAQCSSNFCVLCVISSKPVSWGGTWWYMILDHTHLRFCLKSQKMRAASVEFRGVNEKDHCVQQFNPQQAATLAVSKQPSCLQSCPGYRAWMHWCTHVGPIPTRWPLYPRCPRGCQQWSTRASYSCKLKASFILQCPKDQNAGYKDYG